MAKDPICGMNVNEKTTKLKSDHMGKTYYFCSQTCKTTFDKNPAKYAGGQ
jgi:YHS domain-containing protein